MKKKQPNCVICKWGREATQDDYDIIACMAQGCVPCNSVYMNKICKKLYEAKDARV